MRKKRLMNIVRAGNRYRDIYEYICIIYIIYIFDCEKRLPCNWAGDVKGHHSNGKIWGFFHRAYRFYILKF